MKASSVPGSFLFLALLAVHTYGSGPADDWLRQVEIANAFVESGELDRAGAAYAAALDDATAGGNDLRAGVALQNLGRLFDRKGQLREAERAYLRAISAFGRARPIDDRLLVRASSGLSAIYIQTGQYTKAETLIRRVLGSYPAGADSDRASLLGNLGAVLSYRQQFIEAARVLQQAVDSCAGATDEEMKEAGSVALANLGGLRMLAGDTGEALASYRHALQLMESLPHPAPLAFASTLAGYAKAAYSAGDLNSSVDAYRRAIAIAERQLGPNHVALARLLQGYAGIVRATGGKAEARRLMETARRIQSAWDRENMTGHTIDFNALLKEKR